MLRFSGAYDAGTFHAIVACVPAGPLFSLKLQASGPLAVMGTAVTERLPMKIALVAQHATAAPGDSTGQVNDTRLRELSRSLASNGHRVTVYAQRTGRKAQPAPAQLEPGVTVEYVGPSGPGPGRPARCESELLAQVPAFSRPLHERWSCDRPDVVHAVRWTSGLASLAAARDLRIPVVQTFDSLGVAERRHHLMPSDAGHERIRLEPAIGRSASAVVAGSSDEQSDLTRLGVPRRHIRVVPSGVDTDEFSPEGLVAERTNRPRLVTVADLSETDALANLLRAMSRVPGADLIVAGGPARDQLRGDIGYRRLVKLADSLGVSSQVTFAGQVGRACLPPLFRSADLLVSVSEYDPSGLTSIQAMSCGTPVIASAVGAQSDAVVDGTTGILVPPGRPALLAQRIRQLLHHPMLLEAFSVAAADRARSRYSWDRIAHETVSVYDTALDCAAAAA
jgi:glycosyltransferase involved in cell wall biosynthesis